MNHIFLILACILSIEIFIRFNFLSILTSILRVTKRIFHIIPHKNISDHWKEKIIPIYAFSLMKYSLHILIIFMFVLFLFFIAFILSSDFLELALSYIGLVESIIAVYAYLFIRKLIIR